MNMENKNKTYTFGYLTFVIVDNHFSELELIIKLDLSHNYYYSLNFRFV